MTRLVLAALAVALLAVTAALAVSGLSRALGALEPAEGETNLQRTAFFLLIALILYVSLTGGV